MPCSRYASNPVELTPEQHARLFSAVASQPSPATDMLLTLDTLKESYDKMPDA